MRSLFWNLETAGFKATIKIKAKRSNNKILEIDAANLRAPRIAKVKMTIEGLIVTWVLFLEFNQSNIVKISIDQSRGGGKREEKLKVFYQRSNEFRF